MQLISLQEPRLKLKFPKQTQCSATDIASKLAQGALQLAQRASELTQGAPKLALGALELAQGMLQLAQGASEQQRCFLASLLEGDEACSFAAWMVSPS